MKAKPHFSSVVYRFPELNGMFTHQANIQKDSVIFVMTQDTAG